MTSNKDQDPLSALPDSILISILSLLDAREIIQTWLLSKRWCNLWRFVPCLVFNDDYFRDPTTKKIEGQYLDKFQNFVGSFLRLRDDSTELETFKLKHRTSSHSMSWINYASSHNPKFVDLHFSINIPLRYYSFHLTDSLFTCESILELSFYLMENVKLDKVFMPKLRTANFEFVSMDQESLQRFLDGCPALESLSFKFCKLKAKDIYFQTVKKLTFINCLFMSPIDPQPFSNIFAPQLEYLKFDEGDVSFVKFKAMSKVKKAEIIASNLLHLTNKWEYFSSFSCVEDLSINSILLKGLLEKELPNCPTFWNLKKLTLGKGFLISGVFDILRSFLKHCPNLEHLILHHNDTVYKARDLHYTDLDAHKLARLLVESTNLRGTVQITLLQSNER